MRTDELDYELPPRLIAARPADRRDAARLLVTSRGGDAPPRDVTVADLPDLLRPGDLLVLNDTRVLPARFHGIRSGTGGHVEGLYLDSPEAGTWRVMLHSGGRLEPDERIALDERAGLELIEKQPEGVWLARLDAEEPAEVVLDRVGRMPVPPYIRKARGADEAHEASLGWTTLDRERYQTVYASEPGAVAAPTAGLHFTDELLGRLGEHGVETARLTLHVGRGTFAPVRTETLEAHAMHSERFTVPGATLDALRRARREGRRVIAVGTTVVRALESLPDDLLRGDDARDHTASTDLLIQPPYRFRCIDGLMTNFHLPRSTLLALVAALTGLDRLMALYRHATEHEYRFYSYGDAMLILPE